jgi:hypothetical protein
MIILSNSIAQTINPGQSATFDTVIMKKGCSECFRPGSGAVFLRKYPATYDIDFSGNIGTAAAGTAQLAIAAGSAPMLNTTMISETAAAGDLNSVSKRTAIDTCGCGAESCTIVNTGTEPVTLGANPTFYIRRIA